MGKTVRCTEVKSKVTKKQAEAARKNPNQGRLDLSSHAHYNGFDSFMGSLLRDEFVMYGARKYSADTIKAWTLNKIIDAYSKGKFRPT